MAATTADRTVTDRPVTPWRHGRLDGRSSRPTLLFGRTWEDPAVEDALFPPGGRVLCIASAGDTARSLAAGGRSVVAVDINPAQLDEVRRRLAGHPPRSGSADRRIALARAALAPLGWRSDRLAWFCALDDAEAQVGEWQRLCSPAVRTAVRAGLSRHGLRLAYGADFARLAPPRFGDLVLDRIRAGVATGANRDNPWLALLLTGTWTRPDPEPGTGAGPIELCGGDVADVLADLTARSLDGISLSNVLDGPGPAYAARLLAAARRAARPGAPIIVRTLLPTTDAAARRRAGADRSLLWGGITVHRA
jgi:hypothetical protein